MGRRQRGILPAILGAILTSCCWVSTPPPEKKSLSRHFHRQGLVQLYFTDTSLQEKNLRGDFFQIKNARIEQKKSLQQVGPLESFTWII